MSKSALNSVSPMGASEYIQFVSWIDECLPGTQDRKRKPSSRDVTNEAQVNEKKS
jgi:hypothetical protein